MNPYLQALALGIVALVQVSFLPVLPVAGVSPDLMLVAITSWALLQDTRSAVAWAVVGGLWLDLLTGGPFGYYTLGLVVAALVASLGRQMLHQGNQLLPLVMIVLVTLAQLTVQMLMMLIVGGALPAADGLLRLAALQIALNLIAMAILYPLLSRLARATGRERLPLE